MHRISLPGHLFPVQALFNAIPEDGFAKALGAFSRGIGVGYDEASCEFSGEEDGDHDGVRFWIFNETATVSNAEFFEFLSAASECQIKEHPEQSSEISCLIEKIRLFLTP